MSQESATNPLTQQTGDGQIEALGPLSDLERGIQGLKKLYEERLTVESKLAEAQAILMTRETELAQRNAELAETRAAAEQHSRELEELRGTLARQTEELAHATSDLGTLRSEFEARKKDQEEAEKKRESEAEKSRSIAAELDSFASELHTLQSELEQEKARVESQRAALLKTAEQIKKREVELAAVDARAAEIAEREEAVERARTEVEKRQGELSQAGERSKDESDLRLKAEIEASEQLRSDLESIARRCAAQEEVLAEYEQLLDVERTHVHKLTDSIRQTGARPEQIEASVAELKQCLAKELENRSTLERRTAELASALERARKGTDRGSSPGTSSLRRSRLKRCRAILREQVTKVRRASEVLAKRFEQCEQVLGQRAQLSAVKRQLDAAAATLAKRAAAKRAGAIVFYGVLTVSLLCALSWSVVNQVFPGTFAAKAEITADGRGRDLSDAELDEWKRSLEATLSEPQFIDTVADRMKRRGYESLATPAAVRTLFTSSLTHDSPSPGILTLEVRAPGAERAARSLDIITTALASDANAARERRADGAVTLIKSPAVAGARPIDDQRVLHAGILLLASSTLTLGLGALVWGRLSKAKQDFEFGSQIDNVLDEAKWAEFTAATTTQRPRGE